MTPCLFTACFTTDLLHRCVDDPQLHTTAGGPPTAVLLFLGVDMLRLAREEGVVKALRAKAWSEEGRSKAAAAISVEAAGARITSLARKYLTSRRVLQVKLLVSATRQSCTESLDGRECARRRGERREVAPPRGPVPRGQGDPYGGGEKDHPEQTSNLNFFTE